MSLLVDVIENLSLNSLCDAWVECAYDSEFFDFMEIPDDYKAVLDCLDIQDVFDAIVAGVDEWLNDYN